MTFQFFSFYFSVFPKTFAVSICYFCNQGGNDVWSVILSTLTKSRPYIWWSSPPPVSCSRHVSLPHRKFSSFLCRSRSWSSFKAQSPPDCPCSYTHSMHSVHHLESHRAPIVLLLDANCLGEFCAHRQLSLLLWINAAHATETLFCFIISLCYRHTSWPLLLENRILTASDP